MLGEVPDLPTPSNYLKGRIGAAHEGSYSLCGDLCGLCGGLCGLCGGLCGLLGGLCGLCGGLCYGRLCVRPFKFS